MPLTVLLCLRRSRHCSPCEDQEGVVPSAPQSPQVPSAQLMLQGLLIIAEIPQCCAGAQWYLASQVSPLFSPFSVISHCKR